MIKIIGPKDREKIDNSVLFINTTSQNKAMSSFLSPFYLGPCDIPQFNLKACNVENAWQYSKVYESQVDEYNNPNSTYYEWAKKGFLNSYAQRYPMGKGKKPLYTFWNNQKLDYIQARKKVYIPLYVNAILNNLASVNFIMNMQKSNQDIILWDFDGYDHLKDNLSLNDVFNNPHKKAGHGFVLYGLITGEIFRLNGVNLQKEENKLSELKLLNISPINKTLIHKKISFKLNHNKENR